VDAGNTSNVPLHNALISAIQDTGETMESFGSEPSGLLAVVLA
jgi:hypothetical protein